MKFIYLLVMIFSNLSYSNSSFDKYLGCYETLTWDGNPVPRSPDFSSRIQRGIYFGVLTPDYVEIPAYEFFLFQGYRNHVYHFGMATPFIDPSYYTHVNGKDIFSFKGMARLKSNPNLLGLLEHRVEIEEWSDGVLVVENHFSFSADPSLDKTSTYELKKIPCGL